MYNPTKTEIEYLIDAAEKTFFEDDIPRDADEKTFVEDIPRYVPYIFFKKAQRTLLLFGSVGDTADLRKRLDYGFSRFPKDQECPEDYKEDGSIIKVLLPFYVDYNDKWGTLSANFRELEVSSKTREKILTTSKALRTALKMLTRLSSEEDFIREKGIPEEFVQDTEYDEGSYNIIESSSTAAATDIQASRVNANMDVPISKIDDIEYLIDAADNIYHQRYYCISYILYIEAQEMLERFNLLIGPAENTVYLRSRIRKSLLYFEGEGIPECAKGCRENESIIKTELRRRGFQANMEFPREIDIIYLIDAARSPSFEHDEYIPKYFPYRLLKEAQEKLENQVPTAYTHILKSRIREVLWLIKDKGIPECPQDYSENDSTIQVLVQFYRKYNENCGPLSAKFEDLLKSDMSAKILLIAKGFRTALKMLTRLERGDTSEEEFIRKNEIPEQFLQDTRYDNRTDRLKIEAYMNYPSKIDIEYLIDAVKKTSFEDDIQTYFPCILYEEAYKARARFKNYQTLLFGHAENTADLDIKFHSVYSSIKDKGINFRNRPEGYRENASTIQVLVQFYLKHYIKENNIDEIREEDEKHKKEGILSPNFQVLEGRSAMRERILTTSKALRTAIKMLCWVERGDTPEEFFIEYNEIPREFLQDTEYDEEGSSENYNIIPFDSPTNWLPEVVYAINQLKLAGAGLFSTGEGDVLDRLEKIFKFQKSSVSNQRENIVNLLSNELMRLGIPGEPENAFNEALKNVFVKTLKNYKNWCSYLHMEPIWENTDENATGEGENAAGEGDNAAGEGDNAASEGENAAGEGENAAGEDENVISNEKKILYISLYYLIWGEAANVRFLPECLCYIFHRMSEQLDKYLRPASQQSDDQDVVQVPQPYEGSFIDEVIQPLYDVIAAEAKINSKRDASHSKWRNYDDFNEYFWSPDCFQLGWPLNINSHFFQKPPEGSTTVFGKTSFVEHRTFWHLYHSFHRMWIFHVIMFEALVIFAFNDGNLNYKTLRETLTVTYFLMKLFQSVLDIVLKYGAYFNTSRVDVLRILVRFIWSMLATVAICFPRMKCLQEKTSLIEESIGFKNYITVLGIYAAFKISFPILCQFLSKRYKNSFVARLIKWINQEEYVGHGMDEKPTDYTTYMIFWLVTLAINFAFTYYGLIRPLVTPTRDITDVSRNIHNLLAIGSLWTGVICAYIVGSHVSYNVTSAVVGTYIVGRMDGLSKIKSLGDVHKCFDSIPKKFMDHLKNRESRAENNPEHVKLDAKGFSPFWNQIVMNLREEDYISDFEQYALTMPENSGSIDVIHWPPFLLFGKVFHAIRVLQRAQQHTQSRWRVWERLFPRRTHKYLWNEISRDDVYMKYAVEECLHSIKDILHSVLKDEGKKWVTEKYLFEEDGNLCSEFQLNKLESFVKAISELTEILKDADNVDRLIDSAEQALQNVIRHDFLGKQRFRWLNISVTWPENPKLRSQIKRLHLLLTMKSAAHVPRNREARRRLEFYSNSLFMSMPATKPVRKMLSFSVLTPYYEETVLYSLDELESSNDDGVTLIDYLKNLYPDEWTNYCERMRKRYTDADKDRDRYEYRLWASYRGQTLARTVRGTMYYQKALLFQAYTETLNVRGAERLDKAKAHVDLKFTYVVSCQIYGKQKRDGKDVAADIAFLLKRNEGLRVAFIDEFGKQFYSNLVKADKNGKDTEVYSIKLPGNPILGEGKPENQNHAIVFTRGNAIQTIDMNQDNYFEETLKMRNLLEEFHRKDVIHAPTILGIREHIFTGSASSLASFMSNQETGFVTLGQRVIANPLKVRMHYGHPDVFDRVFHITRGGISKASRGINISEDIYAGFNSTLRQGSVTHHEYIQVGKGRDVGFNQIATFEGKVAGGNGEQVLSRDICRLGQRFDFFRMLSFYYTTVGYYFSSLLMVITLYILLYGNLIMALSGTRVPHVLNDIDMAPEWFLMIVLLPAIYMLLVPYLEQGLEKAVESFLAMFFSLGSIFFAFSLGTRIHWFGRTIIHGGASYQATGRGFVLHHIRFSENYRRYSRSHFIKGMEVLFLVVVYIIYGFHSVRAFYNNLLLLGGSILSISWIVAPFLFDSSPFDPNKNSEDWEDWNNWRNCKSVRVEESLPVQEGVPVEKCWESWWNKELDHIRTPVGRVVETILSLRFFIFPLVVGYKLDVQELKNSLSNCVIPWICLVGILFAHECFSNQTPVIQLFPINRGATIGALVAIAYYYSAFGDMLAFTIVIITTVWGFISFFSNNRMATIGFLAIAYYFSALGDMLAFVIAFITTLWGILSICIAWKPALEIFSLWAPMKCLAWICDIGKEALSFNINGDDDLGMLLLYFLIYVSDACEDWKPTLERFNLWRPVRGLAWICDTGMGALMFKIANMFSQRSIRRYLVRNMFDQNISELLHNSSADKAALYML